MYIERRFKFPDEQHLVNKTVKFAAALLKHVKLAAFQSQETVMMFPEMVVYIQRCVGEGVGLSFQHNLHHTDHI